MIHGFFLSTCHVHKTWFELSRLKKLYTNNLIEGKQKLLRFRGRFELSRVRVTEGKITVNV